MSRIPNKQRAEKFYKELLTILKNTNMPFMIGGTYALNAYLDTERPTKDIDIKTAVDDYPRLLQALSKAGYKTEIQEQNWIAKVWHKDLFTDIIFAEKNGVQKIDSTWLELARPGTVLGHDVKLEPIEYMIVSKAYIQHKERYDGADIANLILKYGHTLDWDIVMERMRTHWELLLAQIINFMYVYPNQREQIPQKVWDELTNLLKQSLEHPVNPKEKVTKGLMISSQYEPAVAKWGFRPIK